MSRREIRLGRLAGVEVGVDVGWVLVVAIVIWFFWERYGSGPGAHPVGIAVAMAVAAGALFFGSILAHELAHALEARHRGIEVRGITLYIFGGATETIGEPRRPVDEFVFTFVGPYTSLVTAALLGLCTYGADRLGLPAVASVTGIVAWLNLALAVFNLLPGAPLDGGRMLEAVAWRVTHDRPRAQIIAARTGRFLGGAVAAVGLFVAFFVLGLFLSGLWLVFIGWFLLRAATAELFQAELRQMLAGHPASDLVPGPAEHVRADDTVQEAIDAHFRLHHVEAVAVGDPVVGVARVDDVRKVHAEERATTPVRSVMHDLEAVPSVSADDPALQVMSAIDGFGIVAVRRGAELVGLVSAEQLEGMVRRLHLLTRGPAREPASR